MESFKEALTESPVGMVGRTGAIDAKAHVTPELRAEFKKLVKKLGGKTVARQLLAEMNAGGVIEEAELEALGESAILYSLLAEVIGNLSDASVQQLRRVSKILSPIEDENKTKA